MPAGRAIRRLPVEKKRRRVHERPDEILRAGEAAVGDLDRFQPAAGNKAVGGRSPDADNPAESQVLIPARERDEIDWDMANRLATENRDFLEYVKLVKQFYQTGEARSTDWDIQAAAD